MSDQSIVNEQLRLPSDERIYAIGDIHGRIDLLAGILANIRDDAKKFRDGRKVRIVFMGDYIDRGDDSAKVVEALANLKSVDGPGIQFLLGNHESALLDFLKDPSLGKSWLSYGAVQTLASYGVVITRTKLSRKELFIVRDKLLTALGKHVDFLKSLKLFTQSGNVIFVHASLNPNIKNPTDDKNSMLWGHPDFLVDQPISGKLVVHGHFDKIGAICRPGRICVDSGGYYSGELTAVRLDDRVQFLSAKSSATGPKSGIVYS